MSSFRTAIEYAEDAARYQRSLCDKRKLNRADEKEKEDEEFDRIMTMNNDDLDHTKLQLEQEKQVKVIIFIRRWRVYYFHIILDSKLYVVYLI